MKKVLIVGNKGNMGVRHTAICKHLGIKVIGQELGEGRPDMTGVDGIIVASSTASHTRDILNYSRYGLPFLCEKPVSKLPIEIDNFVSVAKKMNMNIRMINQYEELIDPNLVGDTHYNYFKTGMDTLAFDCINIIGLAKGKVTLQDDSPVWDCQINGQKLNLGDMDQAYISMIEKWAKDPKENLDYIRTAHLKVFKYIQGVNKRCTI